MIAACVKWTDLRPEIDPLVGTVEHANHGAGFSESDRAAVEVALRLGEAWGQPVRVACVGPAAADAGLRELLAAGVDRVVRIHGDGTECSQDVATRLAVLLSTDATEATDVTDSVGAAAPDDAATELLVVCGDLSADRGSGSVPAFLAGRLGAAQALGLVGVDVDRAGPEHGLNGNGTGNGTGDGTGSAADAHRVLRVVRRLDGGRRERLTVRTPAVISVEGAVADLRRAPLAAVLRTQDAPIEVRRIRSQHQSDRPRLRPWRPRARVVPPPHGDTALDRIVQLTGALVERTPPVAVELPPDAAARAILEQLRSWGYLDEAAE